MMIGHDHRHSQRSGISDLLPCRNAVVTGHDRIRPRFPRLFDQMIVQSISVMDPVRDHRIHNRSKMTQTRIQYISGTDPVNIIIPYDTDRTAFLYLPSQNFRCLFHILQQERIVQLCRRTV